MPWPIPRAIRPSRVADRPDASTSIRTALQLDDRPLIRLVLLYVGLVVFGFSLALIVAAELGNAPWDVFHQGVSDLIGLSIGVVVILTSGVVLLGWIPLRERVGIGTISNAVVVGLALDASLAVLPELTTWAPRAGALVAGVVLNGMATGMYVGAGLGPGPRDGLMTGLARRGWSIRLVRTTIELVVLATGIALGGTFGVGTVVFAATIGPLAQVFIPMFTLGPGAAPASTAKA